MFVNTYIEDNYLVEMEPENERKFSTVFLSMKKPILVSVQVH